MVAMIPQSALAQEHLDPEPAIHPFSSADRILMREYARSLKSVFGNGVRVFAVMDISWIPGFAVGLTEIPGGYKIFGSEQTEGIRSGLHTSPPIQTEPLKLFGPDGKRLSKSDEDRALTIEQKGLPHPTPKAQIGLKRCTVPIDRNLATKVVQSWDAVMSQTRSSWPPRYGADGDQEHFASLLQSGMATGQTWSPQLPNNPGQLSRIAWDMFLICQETTAKDDAKRWEEIKTSVAYISARAK